MAATQCGWVAQLAEQRTENPRVGGSIPPPAISMRMRRGAAVVQLARVELAGSLRDEAALFVRFAYFADWGFARVATLRKPKDQTKRKFGKEIGRVAGLVAKWRRFTVTVTDIGPGIENCFITFL